MSYTFLAAAGEESSVASFSDIPASVLSRLNLTGAKPYSSGNETASSQSFPSGMTCEPSTEGPGEAWLTSWREVSPVKTSALVESCSESKAPKADFGSKWHESFARWNPQSRSWKIRQLYLFEDLEQSLEIWPKWGSMQNGECSELPMPYGLTGYRLTITNALEFSSRLPTPTVHGNYNRKGASKTSGDGLATVLRRLPTPTASDNKCQMPPKNFKVTKTGMIRHLNP